MLLFLTVIAIISSSCSAGDATLARPSLIANAAPTDIVHYFGVGSNMLKSKLINRGLNGTTIDIIDFQPACVKGHRLAFNMRGFPPLEPGMGALEPDIQGRQECHGALCTMHASEYEKVWLSEGGGAPKPGYEEIVVQAHAYGSDRAVPALALRARPHARLHVDACPSQRYMDILISGATELGIEQQYIDELESIQVQQVGSVLRFLAIHYLYLITSLFRLKMQGTVRALSWMLWRAYVPSTCSNVVKRWLGSVFTGVLLLPGASIGALIRLCLLISGTPPSPMLAVLAAAAPSRRTLAASPHPKNSA